jgi:cytochrome P450
MYTDETPAETGAHANALERVFTPECANDPHTVYTDVLQQCPVTRSEGIFGGHGVSLARYEDVLWALKHPEVFSSKGIVQIGNDVPLLPLSVDPPEHAKYRRMLDPQFAPRRMTEMEPEVRRLTNEVIDTFVDRGEVEFHEEFATPLPSTYFLALMGLPHEDLPDFLKWRDDTIRPEGRTEAEITAKREAAGQAIENYFEAQIEEKRKNPDEFLLSTIVHGQVDGRPMTHEELIGTTHLLLLAGLDTVTATLDCMIVHLAQHPEQRKAIVENPALIPGAIEEMLRHQTPVMMVPRIVAQDYEIDGHQIKAGDSATLLIGAANCDFAEFDAPADVSFDREANRHLAFGGGPHRCLGSHFARLELRVALEEFHRRIPEYDIVPGTDISFSPGIRQAENLPLRFPVS